MYEFEVRGLAQWQNACITWRDPIWCPALHTNVWIFRITNIVSSSQISQRMILAQIHFNKAYITFNDPTSNEKKKPKNWITPNCTYVHKLKYYTSLNSFAVETEYTYFDPKISE